MGRIERLPLVIVGIDPGQTGAFVLFDDDLGLLDVADMPVAGKEVVAVQVASILEDWHIDWEFTYVVIEDVHSMPKQGVASSFKFGKNLGIVIGASCAYPQAFIRPTSWKKHLGLKKTKSQTIAQAKDASRLRAIQTWPTRAEWFEQKAKGQARADAALLAKAWAEGAR